MGRYYAYQALDPEYAKPKQPTAILFSVQDYSGNDVHNIRQWWRYMMQTLVDESKHCLGLFKILGTFRLSTPSRIRAIMRLY
jgi:hypothetical protein